MKHLGRTQLRRTTTTILLALAVQAGFASTGSSSEKTPLAVAQELHVKRTYLEELQKNLEATCLDKNGKLKTEQMITAELSCVDAAVDFNNKVVAFKAEIRAAEESAPSRSPKDLQNACAGGKDSATGDLTALSGLVEGLKENVETGCKKERTVSSCAKDFACNLAGSLAMPVRGLSELPEAGVDTFEARAKSRILEASFSKIRQTWSKFDGVCPKQNSQCFEQIMHGVVKALWSDIAAIGALAEWAKKAPGAAWNGTRHLVQDIKEGSLGGWIFDKLHQDDSKVALTQHLAGQLTDAELRAAAESNQGKISAVFGKIFKSLSDSVRENYACEKFKPGSFQCEVPLQSWACASCGSIINSICGVVGVLGAEFVTSALIGGVTGVASVATEAGVAFSTTARKSIILSSANSPKLQAAIRIKEKVGSAFSKPVGSVREVSLFQSVSASAKNVLQRSSLIKDLASFDGIKSKFPYVARRTKDGVLYVANRMQNVAVLKTAGAAIENKVLTSGTVTASAKTRGAASTLSKVYTYSGAKLAVNAVTMTAKGVVNGAGWYLNKLDQGFRLGYNIPKAPFNRSLSGALGVTGSVKQSQLIDSTEFGNADIETLVGAADGPITAEQMKAIEAIQARQLDETRKILDANNVRYSVEAGAIKIHEFDGNFGRMIRNRLADQAAELRPLLARDLRGAIETSGEAAQMDHVIDRAVESFLTKHTTYHPSNAVFFRLYENGTITKKQMAALVKGVDSQALTEELKADFLKALSETHGILDGGVKLKSTFALKPDYLLSREVLLPGDLGSIYDVGDSALVQIARRNSQHAGGHSGLESVVRSMPEDAGQANHVMHQYRKYSIEKSTYTRSRLRNYSAREVTNIANEAADRAETALQANGILFDSREYNGVRYFVIRPQSTGNELTLELSQRAQFASKRGARVPGTVYIPGDSVLKDSEAWQTIRGEMKKTVFSDRDYRFLSIEDLNGIRHAPTQFSGAKVEVVKDLLALNEENKFVGKEFAKAVARRPSFSDEAAYDAASIRARNRAMDEYYDSLLRSIDVAKANQLVERTEEILRKSFIAYQKIQGADGRVFLKIEKNYKSSLNVYASFHDREVLFYPDLKEVTSTARASALTRLEREIGYDSRHQTFISLEEIQDTILLQPELIERFRQVTTAARPQAYSELMDAVRKAARQTTNVAGQAGGEHGAKPQQPVSARE